MFKILMNKKISFEAIGSYHLIYMIYYDKKIRNKRKNNNYIDYIIDINNSLTVLCLLNFLFFS